MSTMTLDSVDTTCVAPRAARPAARPSTVRLTRRGRLVVFVLALLTLAILGVLGASMAGASGRGEALRTHTVTVAPGMTLWDLASRAAHGGDVLAMERQIASMNGLSDGMLIAGQSLRIPS